MKLTEYEETRVENTPHGFPCIQLLKVHRKNPTAVLTQYQDGNPGGMDLRSAEEAVVKPQSIATVTTGLAVELPRGHEGLVYSLDGLAIKHGITVLGAPKAVKSSHHLELKVALHNSSSVPFKVERGMPIARLTVVRAARVVVIEVWRA